MAYKVYIRRGWDFIKVENTLKRIGIKHTFRRYKSTLSIISDVAQTIARSWRARVSRAPYNYRSLKPGPHSRSGGVPLEKSIRVVPTKQGYRVVVLDSPSHAPDYSRPPAYAHYSVGNRGAPRVYKDEAVRVGLKKLHIYLNSIK